MTSDAIFITRVEPEGDGPRLAVKDVFDTAGVRTTYGTAIFADHVPDRTAESVRRLEAAGYVLVGKANLHELGFGLTSENPHYGTVPNPLRPGRIAGGSSGGSAAALAAGLADAALGSDTGGSIRARPHAVASSDSSRPLAWSRSRAVFRWLPASTTWDRWRARSRTVRR